MARPKEFDRNRALDKAMRVFWCKGYEATSLQDLVEAMGVSRQSIYDTFGDKHHLFIESLDYYEALEGGKILARAGYHSHPAWFEVIFNLIRPHVDRCYEDPLILGKL